MTVEESFEAMQELFNPATATGLNKTIQWNISGEQTGSWAVKIENQTCQLIKGSVDKADLTLSMSDQTWLDIAEGRLDPMKAFLSGKVKTAGDVMLATRINQVFSRKK
jgi:putative sterol carrier protein